jgi:adenylate cyclase
VAVRRDLFAEGLEAYRGTKWDIAERVFRDCLTLCPDDGPSRAFIERVPTLRLRPPAGDWNGVWEMASM